MKMNVNNNKDEEIYPSVIASIDSHDLPDAPMDICIAAQNIDFHYGNFQALKGITLPIARKSVTAFI